TEGALPKERIERLDLFGSGSQICSMQRHVSAAEMLRLHLAPRIAKDRINRGSEQGASTHAEHWIVWIREVLVASLIDKEHEAVWMHLQPFALRRSKVRWVVHICLLDTCWTCADDDCLSY